MFNLVKTVGGVALIAFAIPQLRWESMLQMLFSGMWVLFAICYVVANWRVWREDKQRNKELQEYRWRKNWIEHKRKDVANTMFVGRR